DGDDQFGRIVADDAAATARIEHVADRLAAVPVLAAAAAYAQRLPLGRGVEDTLAEQIELLFHVSPQKRGRSANLSAPRLTCMRPYSAQRCSVGIALVGLSSMGGSKAALTPRKAS